MMYKLPEQSIKQTLKYFSRGGENIKSETITIDREEIHEHEYINTDKIVKVLAFKKILDRIEKDSNKLALHTLIIFLDNDSSVSYKEYSFDGIPEKFVQIINDLTKDYDYIKEEKLPAYQIVNRVTHGEENE